MASLLLCTVSKERPCFVVFFVYKTNIVYNEKQKKYIGRKIIYERKKTHSKKQVLFISD